jgi:hypothetical protein
LNSDSTVIAQRLHSVCTSDCKAIGKQLRSAFELIKKRLRHEGKALAMRAQSCLFSVTLTHFLTLFTRINSYIIQGVAGLGGTLYIAAFMAYRILHTTHSLTPHTHPVTHPHTHTLTQSGRPWRHAIHRSLHDLSHTLHNSLTHPLTHPHSTTVWQALAARYTSQPSWHIAYSTQLTQTHPDMYTHPLTYSLTHPSSYTLKQSGRPGRNSLHRSLHGLSPHGQVLRNRRKVFRGFSYKTVFWYQDG